MDEATIQRLIITRGPDFPPVANALAELPDAHPLKVQAAADKAAADAHAASQAALRSAADTAKGRAGGGSTPQRLADIEARLAALEAGA